MARRISPLLWPLLALSSPILVPWMFRRNRLFTANRSRAEQVNRDRIEGAKPLDLPALDYLELTVLVEQEASKGFRSDPGVSYLVRTNEGALLFDVGFGRDSPTLAHNTAKLGVRFDAVDCVVISHLHPDHMGGLEAFRSGSVRIPGDLASLNGKPCFLPDDAGAEGLDAQIVEGPRMLTAGIATTGPLARSLFFLGLCEELALVARLRDKGLVVITGCGHPTVEVILDMVSRLSEKRVHAISGGIHFPVTESRAQRHGIQLQMLLGTGKPPWQRIRDEDLSRTIANINAARPRKVLLSAHDTCDHALGRMSRELGAETAVLAAGVTYRL